MSFCNAEIHLALSKVSPDSSQLAQHLTSSYANEGVYWYSVGSDILLSINPEDMLNPSITSPIQFGNSQALAVVEEELYAPDVAVHYMKSAHFSNCQIPHIYSIASRAYYEMVTENTSKSIACLGTAGSGKTETIKLLLQQFMLTNALGPVPSSVGKERWRGMVNAGWFILESFSCVSEGMRVMYNRSCDSKSVQLFYNRYDGALCLDGLQFKSFSFDYWRSTGRCEMQEGSGRNFHVFYYLLAGLPADLANAHGLTVKSHSHWKLLNYACDKNTHKSSDDLGNSSSSVPNFELNSHDSDKAFFQELEEAFRSIGIEDRNALEIYALLAGLIHLGNIEFVPEKSKIKDNEHTGASIKTRHALSQAAMLLCIGEDELESLLLQSVEVVDGACCSVILNVVQAEHMRDSLIAFIYWATYQWLLLFINRALAPQWQVSNNQLSISLFESPSSSSIDRSVESMDREKGPIDFLRSLSHQKWLNSFWMNQLDLPLNAFRQSGYECNLYKWKSNNQAIAECKKIEDALRNNNENIADVIAGCSSVTINDPRKLSVSVEWVPGDKETFSLCDSSHHCSIWRGAIHCNWVNLISSSGNSILKAIASDSRVIECVDFNKKTYLAVVNAENDLFYENLLQNEKISFWIVHLSCQTLFSQLEHFKIATILQRKKVSFDIDLTFELFLIRFGVIIDAMGIDRTAENIPYLFSNLKISPGMFQMGRNRIFITFETIRLLEECLQDVTTFSVDSWLPQSYFPEAEQIVTPNESEQTPLIMEIPKSLKSTAPKSLTNTRKRWLSFTRLLTWWVPDKMLVHFGNMDVHEVRQAWREKLALCMVILIFSSFMLFNVTMLAKLICPTQHVFTMHELAQFPVSKPHICVFGHVYDITKLIGNPTAGPLIRGAGTDMSYAFKFTPRCSWARSYKRGCKGNDCANLQYLKPYYVGDLGFSRDSISTKNSPNDAYITVNNRVYNLSAVAGTTNEKNLIRSNMNPRAFASISSPPYGIDRSTDWKYAGANKDLVCMEDFFEGVIDQRNSFRCRFAEYLLIGCTGVIVAIMIVKFFSALQFPTKRDPEQVDKYVIMQVPCYTENEQSLRVTIESLACMDYDDSKKLLMVICDGMLIGSGNDKPTPRLVLDILGVPSGSDPEPLSYLAIADGSRRHNMAKVYAGLYRIRQHTVPFIVLAKCGFPGEHNKPGNRGKRDSQMVLLNLLNKLYNEKPMTPMEIEICRLIQKVIGVDPKTYEFILQVDADTEVAPDALTKMVSALNNDSKIIGLCGETEVGNEKASLITMMQVYEYYISHHLAKAFESLFGTVTCLPGCFSIFRIRSVKNEIYLVADPILNEYSDISVNTLHKKNLLHLGEDRYLTTLLIKNFPYNKLCFIGDAKCKTIVPDSWSILVSQRRRWINSTVHNLFELILLNELCGFCFFSMKFVVMIDLFATLVMPATVVYLVYLIIASIAKQKAPIISLIMFSLAYTMQAAIFLIKGQVQHIGWMLLNIFSMPVFNFYIPLYAFWHFDDFSWGNTRRVVGENGKVRNETVQDVVKFDDSSITTVQWSQCNENIRKTASITSKLTAGGYEDVKDGRNSVIIESFSKPSEQRDSLYPVPKPYQETAQQNVFSTQEGTVDPLLPNASSGLQLPDPQQIAHSNNLRNSQFFTSAPSFSVPAVPPSMQFQHGCISQNSASATHSPNSILNVVSQSLARDSKVQNASRPVNLSNPLTSFSPKAESIFKSAHSTPQNYQSNHHPAPLPSHSVSPHLLLDNFHLQHSVSSPLINQTSLANSIIHMPIPSLISSQSRIFSPAQTSETRSMHTNSNALFPSPNPLQIRDMVIVNYNSLVAYHASNPYASPMTREKMHLHIRQCVLGKLEECGVELGLVVDVVDREICCLLDAQFCSSQMV